MGFPLVEIWYFPCELSKRKTCRAVKINALGFGGLKIKKKIAKIPLVKNQTCQNTTSENQFPKITLTSFFSSNTTSG
jgi:hypothetical protein